VSYNQLKIINLNLKIKEKLKILKKSNFGQWGG
jgi:hypothetical protein